MTTFRSGAVVRRATTLQFSRLDNELLAIDSNAGFCYSLNETAGVVWELIEQPLAVGAICTRLQQEYSIDEATCLADLSELLMQLRDAKLVVVDDATVA